MFLTSGSTFFGKLQQQADDRFVLTEVLYVTTSEQGPHLIKRRERAAGSARAEVQVTAVGTNVGVQLVPTGTGRASVSANGLDVTGTLTTTSDLTVGSPTKLTVTGSTGGVTSSGFGSFGWSSTNQIKLQVAQAARSSATRQVGGTGGARIIRITEFR